jgi:hypothetical protein
LRLGSCEDCAAVFPDIANQSFREARRAAAAHLGEMNPCQQGRNGVTKSLEPKVDFAQSVEE